MLFVVSCGPSVTPPETTEPAPEVTEETPEQVKTEVSEQENERIILRAILSELQEHYNKLNKKYMEKSDTFVPDELDWGIWSSNWNRELSDIRNRLDEAEVNVPDYQAAKRFLAIIGGDLFMLWSEYHHNLTEGKEVDPLFKEDIESFLKEAKELLKGERE